MEELQMSIETTVNQRALFYNATSTYLTMKRIFDLLLSSFIFTIFLPIFVLVAAAIKATSSGPVFEGQLRNGFKGKVFKLYSFRTTVVDKNSITNKSTTDSSNKKLTKVGRIIKGFGINNLPQLINVIIGDMSIVGPNPPLLNETFKYDAWHKLRLSVKPGILCLGQVYEARKTGIDEMARLDIRYIRERSFKYDMKIILKSIILTKRNLDFVCALIGFIILIPIMMIISSLVKLGSKGPAMFKHKRIGQYGKMFNIYKFRTMVPNAQELLKSFTPEQMKEFKENFKLKNDPRITGIGKVLRETSLDEIPQILNILKGEMSIVGPRPIVTDEIEKYGSYAEKFLTAKPGLTGMWQANGRSDTSYEERVYMDMEYIDNMCLTMDIKIIMQTAINVLKRRGAY